MALINWNQQLYQATRDEDLSKVINIITTQSNNVNFNINYQDIGYGYTSLYYASAWGFIGTEANPSKYYEIVKFLLENGADPNITNNDGKSPLWIAASWGHYHIVDLLISKGADLNIQVKEESLFTPLQIASYFQRITVSRYTIRGKYHAYSMAIQYIKAIMNTEKGLHYFPEILQDLETLGNNPAVDPEKDTPRDIMDIVSKYIHFAVVDILVLAGADVNLPDTKGHTALEKAMKWEHKAMQELLIKHGGVVGVPVVMNEV